jgi:outer membrane protein TolC
MFAVSRIRLVVQGCNILLKWMKTQLLPRLDVCRHLADMHNAPLPSNNVKIILRWALLNSSFLPAMCLVLLLLTAPGCSTEHYKAEADEEVYTMIDKKWSPQMGQKVNYRIADVTPGPNDITPDPVAIQSGVLTLAQAVSLATAQSREYQDQKEALYSRALDLSDVRRDFETQWFGSFDADYLNDADDESVAYNSQLGFSRLLTDGTQITTSIAVDWLRYLTGDPRTSLGSVLSGAISKPLLRGSERKVVTENLTQAERNLLYQIRSFNRFRKSFVVAIVAAYYNVLQSLDEVKNAEENYKSLVLAYDEAQLSAEAGRRTRLQADQTKQNMLRAEDSLARTKRNYQQTLDEFKILLALPTDLDIQLDPGELTALAEMDITEPDFSTEDAAQTALTNRLDLANSADQLEDAERKVEVAVDALRADLDLIGGLSASSPDGESDIDRIQFQDGTYSLGLQLDLPLDRKIQRNTYRQKLIDLMSTKRAYEETVDNVKLQVRNTYRRLNESATRYKIQKDSLALAQERVASTNMLLKAGRATSRDLLEAQAALLSAQNETTSTLITYAVSKLNFYRDIGILKVRPDGLWEQQAK